jgi:hypothetical protein
MFTNRRKLERFLDVLFNIVCTNKSVANLVPGEKWLKIFRTTLTMKQNCTTHDEKCSKTEKTFLCFRALTIVILDSLISRTTSLFYRTNNYFFNRALFCARTSPANCFSSEHAVYSLASQIIFPIIFRMSFTTLFLNPIIVQLSTAFRYERI